MQRTINVMVIVIETGGEALAYTLAVIAVTPTAREARDQRGAQHPLCVDDSFMRLFPHRPSESADLTPCLRSEWRPPPAARGDGNDVVHRAMQPNQRREGFLDYPADARLRPVPARVAHRRHVMDHIAERRGLDEEDIGHAGTQATSLITASLSKCA